MKWKTEALGDIAFMTSGGTPSKKNPGYYKNGTIPWVRSGELENGAIRDTEIKITQAGLESSSAKIFPRGTLLIALYGATIGKLAYLEIDACTNQAICGIFENDKVSLKYLYYYLLYHRPNLVKQGVGGAQSNISQTILKKTIVSYPVDISEQLCIVSRIEELFSELDNGVETLQKTKQQLAVYRQAVISTAFPEMTTGNTVRLDEIADISGGITKGRDLSKQETTRLPYLRVANVQNGYLDLAQMKTIELKVSEMEKYLLHSGDVLYTEGGDRDKLGRGTVWNAEIPDCVHQNHVFKARLDQTKANPRYVAYWSMSAFARKHYGQGHKGADCETGCQQQEKAICVPGGGVRIAFSCGGIQRGQRPFWHTALLAKCSVLYALSALVRKCGCRRVGQGHLKQQENRAVFGAWGSRKYGAGFSSRQGVYKAPVHRPPSEVRDKMSRYCRLWSRWPEAGAAVSFSKIVQGGIATKGLIPP